MKLTFYGAAKMVSGSNFLLEDGDTKIIIDCGLKQGPRYCEVHNFEDFPYDPKGISAVLVTHAHIDHTGRIAKLYKDGFRGEILSTEPTKDFAAHMLTDSMRILSREAEEFRKQPIYGEKDVSGALSLWRGVHYHEEVNIGNLGVTFYDAGHVLGSSFVVIRSGEGKRIIFSGDIGNSPAPLINPLEEIKEVEYVVLESTYGGRAHENADTRRGMLEDIVETTAKKKGVLMIPAFALERTQEIIYELNELVENGRIPRMQVFLDSPLAAKLTGVYKKYSKDPRYFNEEAIKLGRTDNIFDFPGLKLTDRPDDSMAIADAPSPKIIIAGAGMSNGGRIQHHEKRYLGDARNTILFVGYQAVGSLGRRILEGDETVVIHGEEIRVKARVEAIGAYSAHADQPTIINWLKPIHETIRKAFLVHGEEDQLNALAGKIRDELAVTVEIPSEGDEVIL